MPDKVNAPAVSQLAGEIADVLDQARKTVRPIVEHEAQGEKITREIMEFRMKGMSQQETFDWLLARHRKLLEIESALSEREEKHKRVKLAAWNLLSVLPKSSTLVERVGKFSEELESALSALGESK